MKSFKPSQSIKSMKAPKHTKPKDYVRGSAWHKTSKSYRAANPICEVCESRVATEVHHIEHLSEGGDMHAWDNLQSVCHQCHLDLHHGHRAD